MNGILLCEGETDQFLLKEYFIHQLNFRVVPSNSDKKIYERFQDRGIRLQNIKKDKMDIVSSNSHNFTDDLDKILKINKLNASDFYDRIIILTDRDSLSEVKGIWEDIITEFKKYDIEMQMKENQWIKVKQSRDLGDNNAELSVLLMAIPPTNEGALETFLLKVLSNQEGNSFLAEQASAVVKNILQEKGKLNRKEFNPNYLKSRRMQVKAPLAVFFALIRPDRNFAKMGQMMKNIPWDEYAEIQKAFQQFDILKNNNDKGSF